MQRQTYTYSKEMTRYGGVMGDVDAYLVRPNLKEPRPAILLIHEIFGLVDHTKDVSNRFAAQGYVVLAPNLFSPNKEIAAILSPQTISALYQLVQKLPPTRDPELFRREVDKLPPDKREPISKAFELLMGGGLPREKLFEEAAKGVQYLKAQSYVNGKVGTVGFCFGGGVSVEVACRTKTEACIIFYGANPNPIEAVEKIQCPVLGLYGGEDSRINADLDKLISAMVKYKKDFEMKIYPGAPHAFFNDTSQRTYREGAAKDAWDRSLRFYDYAFSRS
jgi:carboxymethylenebutenolidase